MSKGVQVSINVEKIMYNVLTCILYVHYSSSCTTHNPAAVSVRLRSLKHAFLILKDTFDREKIVTPAAQIKAENVSICWLPAC